MENELKAILKMISDIDNCKFRFYSKDLDESLKVVSIDILKNEFTVDTNYIGAGLTTLYDVSQIDQV